MRCWRAENSPALFCRMSGTGSTVFKVVGVTTRRVSLASEATGHAVPAGTRSLITRTSTSVVPIELLD